MAGQGDERESFPKKESTGEGSNSGNTGEGQPRTGERGHGEGRSQEGMAGQGAGQLGGPYGDRTTER